MWVIDQLQEHSETALDPPEKRGCREQFSCKNALDRPSQGMSVREILWFYGRSRKNDRPIRKMAGFYGRLKETGSNRPPRSCNHGAKSKRKIANP